MWLTQWRSSGLTGDICHSLPAVTYAVRIYDAPLLCLYVSWMLRRVLVSGGRVLAGSSSSADAVPEGVQFFGWV